MGMGERGGGTFRGVRDIALGSEWGEMVVSLRVSIRLTSKMQDTVIPRSEKMLLLFYRYNS